MAKQKPLPPVPVRMKVTDLEWIGLEFIVFHLHEADRLDTYGMVNTENPLEVAGSIMHTTAQNKGLGRLCWRNGKPVAALGVYENHKGCWSIWSFGLEGSPDAALMLLMPLLETMVPHVRQHGGRRIECKSRCDRTGMRDLLGLLGFKVEGLLRKYGAEDGADYFIYSYLIEPEDGEGDKLPDLASIAAAITGKPVAVTSVA